MFRKIIYLGIIFISSTQSSFSQRSLGLKAGILYNKGDIYKPGIQVGIYSFKYLKKKLIHRTELAYSNKGKSTRFMNDKGFLQYYINNGYKLNCFDFYQTMGYRFTGTFSLSLGLEISFLIKKGYPASAFGENVSYKKFQLGVPACLIYTFLDNFDLSVKYSYGLTPVIVVDDQSKLKNKTFEISLGYRFNNKNKQNF